MQFTFNIVKGAGVYSKLFHSLYNGSLATRGPWEALVTFQQCLGMCDRFGVVDITAEVISRRSLIPLEIILKGIAELEKPDPTSRRQEEDGRRLTRIRPHTTWGWQIVNYEHYSALRNAEERREYMKNYMRKKRADESTVELLPLKSGEDFAVTEELVAELMPLYPAVDVNTTLREMKGWLIGNPERQKTKRGIRKFITGWLQREQEKHGS